MSYVLQEIHSLIFWLGTEDLNKVCDRCWVDFRAVRVRWRHSSWILVVTASCLDLWLKIWISEGWVCS